MHTYTHIQTIEITTLHGLAQAHTKKGFMREHILECHASQLALCAPLRRGLLTARLSAGQSVRLSTSPEQHAVLPVEKKM